MKGNSGLQMLMRLTAAVAVLTSLVASFTVYDTPSTEGRGKALIIISVVSALLIALEWFLFRNSTKRYIAKISTGISKTERDSLLNFPAPAIIIDDRSCIMWYNRQFAKQVYSADEAYGLDLTELVNIDMDKVFQPEGDLICLDGRFYLAKGIHTDLEGSLSMIYFNDTTDYIELQYEHRQSHTSVIIICIDNFEDLMSNTRESEKAHILVRIEQLIENFTEGTTAFSKKISSDRFYVIMEERHLAPIIDNRFHILEEARTITVDERQNITLSIGVGREAENLAQSEIYAKQALEMCLGRGGDQAAVRTESGYEFFGGVSKGMEKRSKVKTRMVAKAMLELIQNHEKILIMGHRFGDLDSIGSAVGMCSALKKMGKESYVVVNSEQCLAKSLLKYIDEHDINNYFVDPVDGINRMDENTMLIVVDTHNPDLVESKELLARAANIVVIDHHRLMVKAIENCVMFYHEPMASSASEMVAELIEYFGSDAKISAPVAEALLAGIMLDTKSFVMKTGVRTFEAAAFLRKMGADTVAVKKLFANSIETYQQKSALINSAEIYRKCAIAFTNEHFDNIRIAASQAADEMLGIVGVNASFVMYEDNGAVNISARSMGAFNVQIVMENMGGGGHLTMAATQLKTDMDSARKQLVEAIDDYIRNNT